MRRCRSNARPCQPLSRRRGRIRPRAAAITAAVGLAAAGLAGCGGDDGGPTDPGVGPPARLVFTAQPQNAVAGQTMPSPVRVAFQDSAGNTATETTAAVSLALENNPGDAVLLGTTAANAEDGIATFDDLRIEAAAEGYTLVATSGGLTSLGSTAFAVSPAPPAALAFVAEPSEAEPHLPISPAAEVAVFDEFGNMATNAATDVALSLIAAGVTLGGETTVTASDGTARFAGLVVDTLGRDLRLVAAADGLSPDTSGPFRAKLRFAEISGGRQHTCATTAGAATYCWGANEFGEVGDGSGEQRNEPTFVTAEVAAIQVAAGGYHACHLTADGEAACWGANANGQLGDGTGEPSPTPTAVAGSLVFAAITTGDLHTCGVTADGEAYCWGGNDFGQLGDGNPGVDRLEPGPVAGGLAFAVLRTGKSHTCGVTTDGEAYCWGLNGDGQVGDGTTGTDRTEPVAVVGGHTFTTVAAGGNHSCGLTPDGEAYCWGFNASGELGVGTDTIGFSAEPLAVAGGHTFARIEAGGAHSCAVTDAGVGYCWGSNAFGEVGDGSGGAQRFEPSAIAFSDPLARITAGRLHSCAVVASGDVAYAPDTAWCWGDNGFGQLGDGTTDPSVTPTPVAPSRDDVVAMPPRD